MKEITDKIEKIVGQKVKEVIKLHGDASYRAYYRAFLIDGTTRIIMQMPVGKSSASEEITNFKGPHAELPFINVQKFLASLGLRVPHVYTYEDAERLMILEDAGDGLMWNFVYGKHKDVQKKYYRQAIDLLAELQAKASGKQKTECVALHRSFDAMLLNWEFDHFREYLIEARNNKPMAVDGRKLFENVTRAVTEKILKMPVRFTHRDFQSRNLIVQHDESLVMIDFQDALMGPYVYDLVALLRDSYVELDAKTLDEMIKYYEKKVPGSSGSKNHGSKVPGDFHLMTLQRKMKDAGRFVYIDRIKKNPNFLQYIPVTLKYIKNAFEQINDPQISKFFDMLKKYVPEWK